MEAMVAMEVMKKIIMKADIMKVGMKVIIPPLLTMSSRDYRLN